MELDELRQTRDKIFQTPPVEWIKVRLAELIYLLEQNMSQFGQTLRQVLDPI